MGTSSRFWTRTRALNYVYGSPGSTERRFQQALPDLYVLALGLLLIASLYS